MKSLAILLTTLMALASPAMAQPDAYLSARVERGASDAIYVRPVLLENGWSQEWAADYPAEALAAREGGKVMLRVSVDTSSRLVSCAVISSTASARLSNAACGILKGRGKFRYALTQAGLPVTATAVIEMFFQPNRVSIAPMADTGRFVSETLLRNETNLEFTAEPDWSKLLTADRSDPGEAAVRLGIFQRKDGSEGRVCWTLRGDEKMGRAICDTLEKNGTFRVTKPRGSRATSDVAQILFRWDAGRMQHELPSRDAGLDLAMKPFHIPWTVEEPVPRPAYATILFGADGTVKSCRIIVSTGQDAADLAACRHWLSEAKFTPPIDIFGKRFDHRHTMRVPFMR